MRRLWITPFLEGRKIKGRNRRKGGRRGGG